MFYAHKTKSSRETVIEMNSTGIINRIELLPIELQQQVSDFVEFLLFKHKVGKRKTEEFTEIEKAELLKIWGNYQTNPDEFLPIEAAKEQTRMRYGL